MLGAPSATKAYSGPFVAFLCCFALGELVTKLGEGLAAWPLSEPRYWVYPLQTLVAGGLLWRWRGSYTLLRPRWWAGVGVGVLVCLLWIAPQQWLGQAARMEGYRPDFFGQAAVDGPLLLLRWLRLVVVVPLAEEIFWRGWLMRYLIDHHFTTLPVGTFRRGAFLITTAGFCLEHAQPDWPAAILAGVLYGWLAVRTQSLSTCVLAHAVTNAALGAYVMATGRWGFW